MEALNTTENYTGKVLHFDEGNFDYAIRRYRNELFPAINELKEQYSLLPVAEKFTTEVLTDLYNNGTATVEARYEDQIRKDLKTQKLPYLIDIALKHMEQDMQPLEAAIKNVKDVINKVSYGLSELPPVSLEDVSIVDEQPVLNEDVVKARYELRIDSEQREQLYTLMVAMQAAHQALNSYVKNIGGKLTLYNIVGNSLNGSQCLLWEVRDATLNINYDPFNHI